MKNFILLSLVIIGFYSCKEVDKLTQFNMEFNETATISSTVAISTPFDIITPEISTNSEATFSNNDTRKDLIEEIKLTTMDLTIISPANGDFSFLNSIEVFINADGLAETKIASKNNIPDDATAVVMETVDVDIKEYVKAESFSLRFNTTTDELVSPDYDINIRSIFFVDAKVLGQ